MRSMIIGEDEEDVRLFGQRPGCGDGMKNDKTLHFFFAKGKLADRYSKKQEQLVSNHSL